jgi:GAF domain
LNHERSRRLASCFAQDVAAGSPREFGSVCAKVLEVSGAGITIMGKGRAGPVSMSNGTIAALEDAQFTTGDGPSSDAFRLRAPVYSPSFGADATKRWPSFVALARTSGVGSIFAIPLLARGVSLGVLALYQEREGDLNDQQRVDSTVVATVLTETLLGLENGSRYRFDSLLEHAVRYRAETYQASGIVSIQLAIPVYEALVRIRAHAFSTGQDVVTVSAQIVARELRLSNDRPNSSNGF